jgi:uncharacterized OB-fold protein
MNSTKSNATDVDESRLEKYFDPDTLDTEPTLVGSECPECGTIQFPSRERCPECFETMQRQALSRTGTLYTYATVGMGPSGFSPPYTIGYVDLPDGIRLFTTITDDEELEIGREMEVTTGTVSVDDGVAIKGYQFRPVEGDV